MPPRQERGGIVTCASLGWSQSFASWGCALTPRGLTAATIGAMIGLLLLACGGDGNGAIVEPGGNGGLGGQESLIRIEVAAMDSRFTKTQIIAAADTEVTVVLRNQDDVPHSLSFYTSRDTNDVIHRGERTEGGQTREYSFETPAPGSYFFRCDIHPDRMTGSFVVL